MAKDDEVGSVGGGINNEIVKKSLLISTNLNRVIGYLTLKTRLVYTKLKKAFNKALIL